MKIWLLKKMEILKRINLRHSWLFPTLFFTTLFFIQAVTVLDVYLTIRFAHFMPEMELNPINKMIIEFDNNKVQLMSAFRCGSTMFAANLLIILFFLQKRHHWITPVIYISSIIWGLEQLYTLWMFTL